MIGIAGTLFPSKTLDQMILLAAMDWEKISTKRGYRSLSYHHGNGREFGCTYIHAYCNYMYVSMLCRPDDLMIPFVSDPWAREPKLYFKRLRLCLHIYPGLFPSNSIEFPILLDQISPLSKQLRPCWPSRNSGSQIAKHCNFWHPKRRFWSGNSYLAC